MAYQSQFVAGKLHFTTHKIINYNACKLLWVKNRIVQPGLEGKMVLPPRPFLCLLTVAVFLWNFQGICFGWIFIRMAQTNFLVYEIFKRSYLTFDCIYVLRDFCRNITHISFWWKQHFICAYNGWNNMPLQKHLLKFFLQEQETNLGLVILCDYQWWSSQKIRPS